MTQTMKFRVSKDVMIWAIKESQKDEAEISSKYPKIGEWIEGISEPTLKQIESLANYLKIPFGYMFLQTPPKSNVMQVEFRTIDNKLPNISKNLKDTLLEMDRSQAWMRDYRKNLGWTKLDVIEQFETKISDKSSVEEIVDHAKSLLGIEHDWYKKINSNEKAFNYIREKLEDVGVLVMQNGVVGLNTHRKLDLDEFRAFMLYDDIAPLIFINGVDGTTGKMFSLIHEFIHILYQQEDIVSERSNAEVKENERRINRITAEFLMPTAIVMQEWDAIDNKTDIEKVDTISKLLKVSAHALAIKLAEKGVVTGNVVAIIAGRHRNNKKSAPGGDFYRTYNSKMSSSFVKSVVSETESGNLSYTHAFRLLGGIAGPAYNQIKQGVIYG